MNPNVIAVKPLPGHILELTFANNEVRRFDVTPYLQKGVFSELQDESYFAQARVAFGSVQWPNQQDFSHDTLYELSQ